MTEKMRGTKTRLLDEPHTLENDSSNLPPASNTTYIKDVLDKKTVCPECGSARLWKCGLRYPRSNGNGPIQRWLCRSCGYRFSDTHRNGSEPSECLQKNRRQSLKTIVAIPSNAEYCVSQAMAMINLAEVETRNQEKAAGATAPDQATVKGKIIEYVFHLQKEGLRESTLEPKHQLLHRLLALGADLTKPDTVKAAIARLERSESYKLLLCIAYEGFANYYGIAWTRPKYKQCESALHSPRNRNRRSNRWHRQKNLIIAQAPQGDSNAVGRSVATRMDSLRCSKPRRNLQQP